MRKQFSLVSWLFSLAGASICGFSIALVYDRCDNFLEYVLWSGAFFLSVFCGGFLGMQLAFLVNRKYSVQRTQKWLAVCLISGLMIFGVGAGGQALFMLSRTDVINTSPVDMVMLLDASGSMDINGYSGPRTEAATQFVDMMGEEHRLQAISFSGTVVGTTELISTDDSGKATLKTFINKIDSIGGTNFNDPLMVAINTFSAQGEGGRKQAILLLTDGEGQLSTDLINDIQSSQITVFTVRITALDAATPEAQAIIDLANDTGGFDIQLKPAADGSVDTSDILDAFQKAFQSSTESKLAWNKVLLISSEQVSVYQFIIRLLTLVICAVVFGIGYFGRITLGGVLSAVLSGSAVAILISLIGEHPYLSILLICLILGTAYVRLEWSGGDMLDV